MLFDNIQINAYSNNIDQINAALMRMSLLSIYMFFTNMLWQINFKVLLSVISGCYVAINS